MMNRGLGGSFFSTTTFFGASGSFVSFAQAFAAQQARRRTAFGRRPPLTTYPVAVAAEPANHAPTRQCAPPAARQSQCPRIRKLTLGAGRVSQFPELFRIEEAPVSSGDVITATVTPAAPRTTPIGHRVRLPKKRAGIITAGVVVVDALMGALGADAFLASPRGIRHGLLLEAAGGSDQYFSGTNV